MPYDSVVRCAKFRCRARLPALSYAYQYKKGEFSGLYRSSQSKVGVGNNRSPDDQLLLKLIGNPRKDPKVQNDFSNHMQVNCVIYDARNKMAAFGNKVVGKGYES